MNYNQNPYPPSPFQQQPAPNYNQNTESYQNPQGYQPNYQNNQNFQNAPLNLDKQSSYPPLQTNMIPMQYHQQQHYIHSSSKNDPFYNPYFNQEGQTYHDVDPYQPIVKNDIPLYSPIQVPSYNGQLKDHDVNLNYNKYMVFFQYDSVNVYAFDFKNRSFVKCPNYYNFKMLSFFRVVQTPEYGFILTGGSHSNNSFTSNVYYYLDGYFKKLTDMKIERRAHCSIFHEGFVYVFGGLTANGQTKLCERYNIAGNKWESIASLTQERTLASCCLFGKDLIYIIAGYNEPRNQDILEIECYNVRNGNFTKAICEMPVRIENPFVAQINEFEILVMGGVSYESDVDQDAIMVLNVFNGTHKYRGKMNRACWSAYCTPYLINSNSFMVFFNGEEEFLPNFCEVNID